MTVLENAVGKVQVAVFVQEWIISKGAAAHSSCKSKWVCNQTMQQHKLSLRRSSTRNWVEGAANTLDVFCSPCLSGFARCMTREAVYISWGTASCRLTRLHRAGRNGRLGGLLIFSSQLQNGEICHCRKQKNRNIISALPAGSAGIHYWVRWTACTPPTSVFPLWNNKRESD